MAGLGLVGVGTRSVHTQGRTVPGRQRRQGMKESRQLIRRLTDEGTKKREFEVPVFLCELSVLCDFA